MRGDGILEANQTEVCSPGHGDGTFEQSPGLLDRYHSIGQVSPRDARVRCLAKRCVHPQH
jgi:hypothetical protein